MSEPFPFPLVRPRPTVLPDRAAFRQLARQGTRIPVVRELAADLETPVSLFLKLRGEGPAFLLESVERGHQVGRYSFVGVRPRRILRAGPEGVTLDGRPLGTADPFRALQALLREGRPLAGPDLPPFWGGWVGYLAFEAVRHLEPGLPIPSAGPELPEALFLEVDTLLAFDHARQRLLVIATAAVDGDPDAAYDEALDRIEWAVERVEGGPFPSVGVPPPPPEGEARGWSVNLSSEAFREGVRAALEGIRAGEIFQVVLSRRLSRSAAGIDPFAVYRVLRRLNPSPYTFYLELPGVTLVGASPEMLVQLRGRTARVRPIAGTRPRGETPEADARLEAELLEDPKERAEHVMLVDLARNDLGRVCRYGTVRVPRQGVVERYAHVMHLVSQVEGELSPGLDAVDLLRATFPAGTVSGAPKVRAMEILMELEGERRGPYAGAVGYLAYGGDLDTCIAIRTLVFADGQVHVQAGAGIVADSVPERELRETLNKARALAEAVEQVAPSRASAESARREEP